MSASRVACVVTNNFGPVFIEASATAVTRCEFVKNQTASIPREDPSNAVLHEAVRQIQDYDSGVRSVFDVPLQFPSGTPFQRAVWQELLKIAAGSTSSYKEVAARVQKPSAYRAVGSACRSNPLVLFVPCHRVVAANGELTGFAGSSDCTLKAKLIQHEQQFAADNVGQQAIKKRRRA
jgi:methylated-DNA-[protein]-cysteine S-methyltransferase